MSATTQSPLFRNNTHHIQGRTCWADGRILESLMEFYFTVYMRKQHRDRTDTVNQQQAQLRGQDGCRVPTKTPVRCVVWLPVPPNSLEGHSSHSSLLHLGRARGGLLLTALHRGDLLRTPNTQHLNRLRASPRATDGPRLQ